MPKQFTSTPRQNQLEGAGFKVKLRRFFKSTQKAWDRKVKPAFNVATPFVGMAVAAKSKNPQVGQATTKFFKHQSADVRFYH